MIAPSSLIFFVAATTAASIGPNAVNPEALSPSNALSCAKASALLSCQTKVKVDPTSFGTCCYNGALQPGDKESGLILSTQFWDTDPSTGPENSATIHGLWPDYCDATYPQYCTAESGIPEMTGPQIEALIGEYNPALLTYMHTYYKNEDGPDNEFWEHEYNKHGTCYTTLRAKCQTPVGSMNQTTAAVVGYFEEIVYQFTQLPTYNWLAEAGIVPSATKTYSLTSIQNALAVRHGGLPYIGCTNKVDLDEFWYFFHTRGPLVGGQYVPTNSTTASSCGPQVSYLPKYSS